MDEYESLSHSKWECKYHVVFIPKCRRKVLYKSLRPHLGEVFKQLAEQRESRSRTHSATYDERLLGLPACSVLPFICRQGPHKIPHSFLPIICVSNSQQTPTEVEEERPSCNCSMVGQNMVLGDNGPDRP